MTEPELPRELPDRSEEAQLDLSGHLLR